MNESRRKRCEMPDICDWMLDVGCDTQVGKA
jgi:hypothetical protein